LEEGQSIGCSTLAYRGKYSVEVSARCHLGKIPIPKPHVEGGVLAAHEGCDPTAERFPDCERKQDQWSALIIKGNDNEGLIARPLAHELLPGTQEIKPLKWCGEVLRILEAAPDGFCLAGFVKYFDSRDVRFLQPRQRTGRPAFDRGSQGHSQNPSKADLLSAQADLCKESSTKSKGYPRK
jgi:hypothetical protein